MLAELLPKPAYRQYRLRLEASLQIAAGASEQEIHELIAVGFAAERVKMLSEFGVYAWMTIRNENLIAGVKGADELAPLETRIAAH